MIKIPKQFDILRQKIAKNLKGKINPRTKKPYTDSEIWAISVAQWKKTHGGKAPSREESPQWYSTSDGQEIRENVELHWCNEITEFVEGTINENQPFRISGVALVETISKNNIEYVVDEIKKAAPTLIGKPLIDSHKGNESVDKTLGKVIDSYFEDSKSKFVAEIDPSEKKIISKIRNGYINKVSIAGRAKKLVKKVKELEDGSEYEYYKAEGLCIEELSLVTFPGVTDTSISIENALHESFNADFNDNKSIMEDVKMNEEIEALKEEIKSLKNKEELNPEKLTTEISQNILKLLNEKELEGQRSKLSDTIKEKGLEMDLSSLDGAGLKAVKELLAFKEAEEDEEEETSEPEEETSPEEALNGSKGVTANITEQDDVKELMEKCKNAVIIKGVDGMEYYEVL